MGLCSQALGVPFSWSVLDSDRAVQAQSAKLVGLREEELDSRRILRSNPVLAGQELSETLLQNNTWKGGTVAQCKDPELNSQY